MPCLMFTVKVSIMLITFFYVDVALQLTDCKSCVLLIDSKKV